jgi:hypothetical protein
MTTAFPYFEFTGNARDIGYQHGNQARDLVHEHLRTALGKLSAGGVDHDEARRRAKLHYQPYIERYTPLFAQELAGLAEGAGMAPEDAYILQLRAELQADLRIRAGGASSRALSYRERMHHVRDFRQPDGRWCADRRSKRRPAGPDTRAGHRYQRHAG